MANILNPVTQDDHSVKDSFETYNRIQYVPHILYEQGYVFASFDILSLFTNCPLGRTIKIILKRIYDNKQITSTLKKCTMKNLIIDVCKKTIFSFNKQADGVSMDSCGGPVVANIITTEF